MKSHLRPITAVLATLAIGLSAQSFARADEVTGRSSYVNSEGEVVHCVSTESGRTYCGAPHRRYVIVGNAPAECVRGRTWDFDDRGVWVSGGCRADFNVVEDREVASRSTYVTPAGRVVHCVSTESGRTYCGGYHAHYVISGTPDPACVEGTTWGFDKRGIWVTGGCRGDFTYDDD